MDRAEGMGPAMTASVVRIGFTPVKGLRHCAHDHVELHAAGPVGDRLFAFVADHSVLRTVQNQSLLAVEATYDGHLTLRFPDDSVVSGTLRDEQAREVEYWGRPVASRVQQGPHADAMSSYLGFPVQLVRAGPGRFVYGEAVSLVGAEALAELGDLDPARFRPNFVVEADPRPGEKWLLGDAVVEVVSPIIRCSVIDADPTSGASGGDVLKKIADRDPSLAFGVDARVLVPGTVRVGDRVVRR